MFFFRGFKSLWENYFYAYWFPKKAQYATFSAKTFLTMERSFDEGTSVGAIFIDPTIDLDTLNFDLLIAKLEA